MLELDHSMSLYTCIYSYSAHIRIYTYSPSSLSIPSPASKRWSPDHHSYLTFEVLTRELATDPVVLLSWSQQDKGTSSKASVLGAPLEEGKHQVTRAKGQVQVVKHYIRVTSQYMHTL